MDVAIANLSAHLFTKCPHCGALIDLLDQEYDHDNFVAKCIFCNAWDDLKGSEFACEECDKVFYISEVEY
jgi:phage FluMu protein Com